MLSVLTEEQHFKGSLATLAEVATLTRLPLLRKDFLWYPEELDEALACGASTVLLIVAFLEDRLPMMAREASRRGLRILVEIHSNAELPAALDALSICQGVLGINQRNLETLVVDKRYAERVRVPTGIRYVVESGIESRADLEWARQLGASGVLVGESLARAPNPGDLLSQWLNT